MTDNDIKQDSPDAHAIESAMWRILYRLHRKDSPQHFEQLLANLNVEQYPLMEACERLEEIGAVEHGDDGWALDGDRWGDAVLKTSPRVEP